MAKEVGSEGRAEADGRAGRGAEGPAEGLEQALLAAVLARLVPLDGGAGGGDPEVAAAVAARLSQPGFASLRRDVTTALCRLDARARERYGSGFQALAPQERDSLLRELEVSASRISRRFFHVLLTLALEASLSGPVRGAVRERRGWRHMGLDPGVPAAGPAATEAACESG